MTPLINFNPGDKIEFPRTKLPLQNLMQSRGCYYAAYFINGRRKRHSVGKVTAAEAQVRQRTFYKQLKELGATERTPGFNNAAFLSALKERMEVDDTTCIVKVKPFAVRIAGKPIGSFWNLDEAIEARNQYLRDHVRP